MSFTLLLLTVGAALLQVSVVPLLFLDGWNAPMLPVALLAAWSVNRSADAVWPALLPAALLFGVVSAERVGWFLVALLPVALLGAAVAQTDADDRGLLWRLPVTASVAGLGSFAYLLVLATAGGAPGELAEAAPTAASAALWTSVIASVLTPLVRRRRQRQGLFA